MQLFKQHNKYQQTHKLFVCYLLQNELNYSCYISQGEERKMLISLIDGERCKKDRKTEEDERLFSKVRTSLQVMNWKFKDICK